MLDPKKWEPIEAEPIRPGVTPQFIPPPPTSDKNPCLRTTIPSDQQLQPDMVKQQYTSAMPQIRVMPLQPNAKPGVNAAAQSVAKTTVAAIPPARGADRHVILSSSCQRTLATNNYAIH